MWTLIEVVPCLVIRGYPDLYTVHRLEGGLIHIADAETGLVAFTLTPHTIILQKLAGATIATHPEDYATDGALLVAIAGRVKLPEDPPLQEESL